MQAKTFLLESLPEIGLLVFITALSIGWLSFMIVNPNKWSEWVDKENAFWVRNGIVPASIIEKIKRFEKGIGMKILVGTGALLGFLALLGTACLFVKLALSGH